MKQFAKALLALTVAAAAAYAQPSIKNIVNGASYIDPALPNGSIAQGSIFVIKGSNLGPATGVVNSSATLANSLGGSSVTFTVGGTTTKGLITYASATQVNGVIPSNTPTGAGTVTVSYNGQTSASASFTVISSSFGIFTVNSAGSGPAIITDANYVLNTGTHASNSGEAFIIWGTGSGPVTGDETQGTPGAKPANINVQVYVGGTQASGVVYARSGFSGEDQIAALVPSGVTGCQVPVVVQIGSVVSNFATMAIAASGRTCSDSTTGGIDLGSISQKGTASVGVISLSRSQTSIALPPPIGTTTSTTDNGFAGFDRYTYAQYLGEYNPLQLTVFGACTVYTYSGQSSGYTDPVQPVLLDAGPALTITGPNGTKSLPKSSTLSAYSAILGGGASLGIPGAPAPAPLYLDAGNYTVTGPGGADVGAFTASITLPTPLTWTNQSSALAGRECHLDGRRPQRAG